MKRNVTGYLSRQRLRKADAKEQNNYLIRKQEPEINFTSATYRRTRYSSPSRNPSHRARLYGCGRRHGS